MAAALIVFSLTGCAALQVSASTDAGGAEVKARLEWEKLGEEIRAAVRQVETRKMGNGETKN